jgi:glycosyltransferase involved in cell wall biosynthesis
MLDPRFVMTVITPVLNAEQHIEKCLDQVAAQGRDDVEHLIVDGGSTDRTLELVQARVRVDPRVRLVSGPDHGQSHAMNKGVACANGVLLGCLNVDDLYMPGALTKAIAALTAAPVPSFYWGACEVRDSLHGNTYVQFPGRFETIRLVLGPEIELQPLNPCAYFYHRDLHFVAGLFDEAEHYALDLDFLIRASIHAASVITTRDQLGIYILDPGTKTYVDMASGKAVARGRTVRQKYAERLSFKNQLRIWYARWRWSIKN